MTLSLIGTPAIKTVRDTIAVILSTEIAAQRLLATGEYKTILDSFYNAQDSLNIFVARAKPLDAEEKNAIVITTEEEFVESWTYGKQKATGKFSIDIVVSSKSTVLNDGANEAENYLLQMYHTISQILMSQKYYRLGFDPNEISRRKITSMNQYDLQGENQSDYVRGALIKFEVDYNKDLISSMPLTLLGNDTEIKADDYGRFSIETDEIDL